MARSVLSGRDAEDGLAAVLRDPLSNDRDQWPLLSDSLVSLRFPAHRHRLPNFVRKSGLIFKDQEVEDADACSALSERQRSARTLGHYRVEAGGGLRLRRRFGGF